MNYDGTTFLDQPIPKPLIIYNEVTPEKHEETYVLELADRVLGESLEDGNFDLAFEVIEKFRAMNKASSLGIAKILHGVNSHWKDQEETFIQQAVRKTGYSEQTIERYIHVWEMLTGDYIPEEFKENIWNQTMRQLVKEAETVVDQKYELDHDDWLALSEATDYHRTMDVCQAAKGKPRNKNHVSLKLDEAGDIFAYQGDRQAFVGTLNIESVDPLVIKAIHRICNDAGISKKSDY